MRTNTPGFESITWKGPVPMIGGEFWNLLPASLGEIFDQMCSGRIGTHICSMVALGFSQVKSTV